MTNPNAETEYDQKVRELAGKIMQMVQSRLFMEFRFLGNAIAFLKPVPDDRIGDFSTRGNELHYRPELILDIWQKEPNLLYRTYMHAAMHCVFLHQFVSGRIDRRLWNLACDAAIENIFREIRSPLLECEGTVLQYQLFDTLKKDAGKMTAERIYKYLTENSPSDHKLQEWAAYCRRDEHEGWYDPEIAEVDPKNRKTTQDNVPANEEKREGEGDSEGDREETRKQWENISRSIDMELEMKLSAGEMPEGLLQNLKELEREVCDYDEFLRKFAVWQEEITVNDEEFDYISYYYGLSHFGNLPLVEPLEYKENKRILDFVIAIDTSGSVQGELVQKFVNQTWNILQEEENFFHKINLYLIQCDDRIREEVRITSREELQAYMKTMVLKGFGSTDFRPVFERIEELLDAGAFSQLKGLIYFTDGYGVYPAGPPEYDAAFVFPAFDDARPKPPPWVMQVHVRM